MVRQMLVCKKIQIEKNTNKNFIQEGCVSIIVEDEDISHEEIDFIVVESIANNSQFIMIWPKSSSRLEDLIDARIEDRNIMHISTTTHGGESANEVANFAKYAAIPDYDNFYCLVFSKPGSTRAEELIEEVVNI